MEMAEIDALVAEYKNFVVDRHIESGEMPISQMVELAARNSTFHYVLASVKPMSQKLFDALLNNSQPYFLKQLALNDSINTEMQRRLYAVQDPEIQQVILMRIDDKEILAEALSSTTISKLMGVAANPHLSAAQLDSLSSVSNPDVLSRVASNHGTSLKTLEKCVESIASVSQMPHYTYSSAFIHPNVSSELVEKIYKTYGLPAKDSWSYSTYLVRLAQGSKTPVWILEEVAAIPDESYQLQVVSALLENPSTTLSVQEIIAARGVVEELKVLAKSSNTKPEVTAKLMGLNNSEVRVALVQRENLTPALFAELFHDSDMKVRAEFAYRNDLKREHIQAMVADKSALVRE